jgi:hypothetical protein
MQLENCPCLGRHFVAGISLKGEPVLICLLGPLQLTCKERYTNL